MSIKEVYNCCMPAEKRKKERMNIWVALVVRPLSVLFTIPFIKTRVRPSDIAFYCYINIIVMLLSLRILMKE